MWKKIFVAALVAWGAYRWWSSRPVSHGPGVLAPDSPIQLTVLDARSFEYKGYRITPLARFSLQARVLGREDYSSGFAADLSPTDLVFGWGHMSDDAVLKKIDISQSNRFYQWHVNEFPIPRREIETSSANMHLIPSTDTIERTLKKVRAGSLVELRGYLVRVDTKDGSRWISSLTRDDTGSQSCEIIWVEEITVM